MSETKEHRDFLERSRQEFARLMGDLDVILEAKTPTRQVVAELGGFDPHPLS